jgi:hypothetical protein
MSHRARRRHTKRAKASGTPWPALAWPERASGSSNAVGLIVTAYFRNLNFDSIITNPEILK